MASKWSAADSVIWMRRTKSSNIQSLGHVPSSAGISSYWDVIPSPREWFSRCMNPSVSGMVYKNVLSYNLSDGPLELDASALKTLQSLLDGQLQVAQGGYVSVL